jgi:hypothetical protein
MSTSGLSIAMSEESLRSLKYCLQWLRWANDHIAGVISTLKSTLEQYDRTAEAEKQRYEEPRLLEALSEKDADHPMSDAPITAMAPTSSPQDRNELAARIASLKGDVLKTLRDVIETVSKYTGGALPDNARVLVRRHLTSLPQRFRVASMMDGGSNGSASSSQQESGQGQTSGEQAREKELKDGAQRVLVLAKEGLDMMAQVSGVLDGTIVSAEEWCERLGKKRREDREAVLPQTEAEARGESKEG